MSTREPDVMAIGRALAAARSSGRPAAVDTDTLNASQAGEAQEAANAAYGGRPIGYKIGCTSAEAQAIVGADGPFYAVMVDTDAHNDGATIPWSDGLRGVECEIAFRFAGPWPLGDAPPGEAPREREALIAAIATCHPALEVVGRRTPGAGFPAAPGFVADFGVHAAFVEGAAVDGWRDIDLAAADVEGLFNGQVTNRGCGANVLGHPFNALTWLGGELARRGRRIEAGDIVTTGTVLGVVEAAPGAEVVGDFGRLGRVSLRFSDG